MGEQNWSQFAANEVSEMRGHLIKYPVDVDRMGEVRPLPWCETFPDMGGNIIGSFIKLPIQENLTTWSNYCVKKKKKEKEKKFLIVNILFFISYIT